MAQPDHKTIYEIQVQGHLDESWTGWFKGMTITVSAEPEGASITTLTGEIVDQAALQGILLRIHDLNVELISVTRIGLGNTGVRSVSESGGSNDGD